MKRTKTAEAHSQAIRISSSNWLVSRCVSYIRIRSQAALEKSAWRLSECGNEYE